MFSVYTALMQYTYLYYKYTDIFNTLPSYTLIFNTLPYFRPIFAIFPNTTLAFGPQVKFLFGWARGGVGLCARQLRMAAVRAGWQNLCLKYVCAVRVHLRKHVSLVIPSR